MATTSQKIRNSEAASRNDRSASAKAVSGRIGSSPVKSAARRPKLIVLETKRTRRIFILKTFIIAAAAVCAVFSVVMAEGVIAQRQLQIDSINSQIANEQIIHQQLSAKVAKLEAPTRIEDFAQNKLNMVSPTNIIYVNPATPAIVPQTQFVPKTYKASSTSSKTSSSQTAPQTTKVPGK